MEAAGVLASAGCWAVGGYGGTKPKTWGRGGLMRNSDRSDGGAQSVET